MTTYWVDVKYACYGISTNENDIIVSASPIAKWMLGKDLEEIKKWVKRKNGRIVEVKEANAENNNH